MVTPSINLLKNALINEHDLVLISELIIIEMIIEGTKLLELIHVLDHSLSLLLWLDDLVRLQDKVVVIIIDQGGRHQVEMRHLLLLDLDHALRWPLVVLQLLLPLLLQVLLVALGLLLPLLLSFELALLAVLVVDLALDWGGHSLHVQIGEGIVLLLNHFFAGLAALVLGAEHSVKVVSDLLSEGGVTLLLDRLCKVLALSFQKL
jgi:hypothetical protein